jgi:hypothetical protein
MQVSAQRTLNITIDHFVMAVTAAEAGVRHTTGRLALPHGAAELN